MAIQKSVFRSKSEREKYYKLSRAWGDKYNLYHNLPFLNLVNIEQLMDWSTYEPIPFTITNEEFNRLKKTSVDFTLCDDLDAPILSIDFDGMQEGFNVGTTYYPDKLNRSLNPWRRQITELKLKVAHGSMYPYFVIGSKQFKEIPQEVNLTIVDGIIGDVLAAKARETEIDAFSVEKLGMTDEEFNYLSESMQRFYIQDFIDGVDVMTDLAYNPISKRAAQLQNELGCFVNSMSFLNYPPFEPGDIDGFRGVILHGSRVEIETPDMGVVVGVAWLPNFNVPGYSGGLGLVENIATLYALEQIKLSRSQKR